MNVFPGSVPKQITQVCVWQHRHSCCWLREVFVHLLSSVRTEWATTLQYRLAGHELISYYLYYIVLCN